MKLVRGLVKKNLKIIIGKKWYHQRFDGSPHFLWSVSVAELTREKRKRGCHFKSHLVLFEHDKADWYIDQSDIDRVAKKIMDCSLRTPHLSKKLMVNWQKDKKNFYDFCQCLDHLKLNSLTDQALRNLYLEYAGLYLKSFTFSSLVDGFALGTDELIQRELIDLLKTKRLERQVGRYFSALTAPVHHSFINEAEVALLKIALLVEKTPVLAKNFKNKPLRFLRKVIVKYNRIYTLLKKQEKDYFWTKNNYVHNNYIDVSQWVAELKTVFLAKMKIKERIRQIISTPRKNAQKKNKLINYLKPPKKIKVLLEVSEDFTHWQDERKKLTFWSTHYGSLLLAEIGRRFGFNLPEMKYHSFAEVAAIFEKPIISKKEIKSRLKKCLWYQNSQDRYEAITENKARRTYRQIFEKRSLKAVNDFRGLSAGRGVARGPVKIVKSATETKKVKEGDVLVAVMTRPDYIMGIKKAAAIVTNEGGVTCHAAIVSRELNIPCVIGTKIATEVLRDGDLVEVNGNHGVVTVIKKNKYEG